MSCRTGCKSGRSWCFLVLDRALREPFASEVTPRYRRTGRAVTGDSRRFSSGTKGRARAGSGQRPSQTSARDTRGGRRRTIPWSPRRRNPPAAAPPRSSQRVASNVRSRGVSTGSGELLSFQSHCGLDASRGQQETGAPSNESTPVPTRERRPRRSGDVDRIDVAAVAAASGDAPFGTGVVLVLSEVRHGPRADEDRGIRREEIFERTPSVLRVERHRLGEEAGAEVGRSESASRSLFIR